ncbi:YcgL domain-containing protein [Sedimenticola selenatireducens]|uniref:YcgL domain-containing protein n=1 Tax=Sedimenticola selenatireducens TaxID=191960 RepID=UPI002AABDDFE|nr:YcgL domain-containing protein [Sedimenticola selenatireducens]
METDIYQSQKVHGAYLFVPSGSSIALLPNELTHKLGKLQYFKTITINHGMKLIAADADEVIANIQKNGYHLQGASVTTKAKESDVSEVGAAVGGGILAASLGLGPVGAVAGALIGAWLANHSKAGGGK